MCEENHVKLWVIKFCLKVVFPKYNLYLFLSFLAIKYRLIYRKQQLNKSANSLLYSMEIFKMKSVSSDLREKLILDSSKEITSSANTSCLVVPYESYVRMATENPFYIDRGSVWMAMHLSPTFIKKIKQQHNSRGHSQSQKISMKQMKSVIHKQLWASDIQCCNRVRIVQVVPTKSIKDVILVTEEEECNIKSCYDIPFEENDIELHLRPIASMDYVPQIAVSAVVQMILNPFDLSNDFVSELLSNFFKTPRLIHIGDVFGVPLSAEMTAKYHYKYFDLVDSTSKLFFKCCNINIDLKKSFLEVDNSTKSPVQTAFFIVKGRTELSLGENVHSMMPRHKHFELEGTRKICSLIDACPFGLRRHFCRIQEAILPFIADGQDNLIQTSIATPIMPLFLLTGANGSGRHLLVKTLAKYNGMNCMVADCNAVQSTTAKQTESKISSIIQKAKTCSPVIVLMDNFEVFAVDAENNEDCRVLEYFLNITSNLFEHYTKQPIIFIAVTERVDLKPNILRMFLEKFHLTRPTNSDRFDTLRWFLAAMQLEMHEDHSSGSDLGESVVNRLENGNLSSCKLDDSVKEILQRISAKTETFLYGDIDTLVHFALRNSFLKQHGENLPENIKNQTLHLKEEDFTTALESMRALQSQHMDAPKIPKVYWEDIGGLDSLKKELLKTIEFPIKYPHLFKNSTLKRSGILLYGPPGCGKTLVAKALSTELNVSFLSVKGPELLNMYIGQSEENVRKVFESARASSPCIVFLDELDALAPRRGATGDSGGASDRVVSQLLAEIDGVTSCAADETESPSFVFIMGATNRPDLLEQSLLRPGRLDKLVYVGPYCGLQEKTRVLRALCHRQRLDKEVSLEEVAGALPERCTGADLLQVVSVARSAAVRRAVTKLQKGEVRECELGDGSTVLGAADMREGVRRFKPSTTDDEFAYYERLQM